MTLKKFSPQKTKQSQVSSGQAQKKPVVGSDSVLPSKATQDAVEELNTLLAEVSLQNDELHLNREDLEKMRDRLADLYDFAPVGYATVSDKGLILEANLAFVEMVHAEKSALIGVPFSRFILEDDQDILYLASRALFSTSERQICEVRLLRAGGESFHVQLELIAAHKEVGQPESYRVAVSDISLRRKTEEKLHEALEFMRAALDQALVGVVIADAPDGRLRYVNDAALLIGGKGRKELLDDVQINNYVSSWRLKNFDGSPLKNEETPLARALMGSEKVSQQVIIGRDDGENRTIWVTASPVFDVRGQVSAAIALFADITDQRRTEENLRWELKVNSILSELYEPLISPDLTIRAIADRILAAALELTDSKHGFISTLEHEKGAATILAFSSMMEKQCRIDENEKIVFSPATNGFYPGLWGVPLNTGEAFIANNAPLHEAAKGLPEGHIPIVNFLSVPVFINQRIVGQIAVCNRKTDYGERQVMALERLRDFYALAMQRHRDIEKLQEAHDTLETKVRDRTEALAGAIDNLEDEILRRVAKSKELEESERKYSTLIKNAMVGIFIVSDGEIIYVNPSFTEIFGYTKFELAGMDPSLLITQEGRAAFGLRLEQSLAGETGHTIEFMKGMKKDGSEISLNIVTSAITFEGKQATLGNVVDVTRIKELEYQVTIQDKMASLGRVAAGMAHEIRNPLSGINLHLTNLERLCQDFQNLTEGDRENLKGIISNLQSASEKIETVVKRVYDFSKPHMHKLGPIDVNDCVANALLIAAVSLRKLGISVEEKLTFALPVCIASRNLLEQLLMNLITNAQEILEEQQGEKKILITTAAEGAGSVVIKVADNGPGVPRHLRKKIFDSFFSGRKEGLGIGLSICHRIVKDHGGDLTLSTSAELGGAEFIITLPCLGGNRQQ